MNATFIPGVFSRMVHHAAPDSSVYRYVTREVSLPYAGAQPLSAE
jgi:hypothetical protein